METPAQVERARTFASLHRRGDPLLLPNAWDVASAWVVAGAGAAAVATTSAGVAWTLGAPDGDRVERGLVLDQLARIVAAVDVPVSADIESGYGATPDDVAETVRGVLAAGAVGVNIEDGDHDRHALRPVREAAGRVAAARRAADAFGVPLFVNARPDVFFHPAADDAARVRDACERAAAYLDAGADGIFVPGVRDPALVAALVEGIDAPLNVLAGPGSPAVPELAALGVARVSLGPRLATAAYGLARRAAAELLGAGTYEAVAGGLPYDELNRIG